MRTKGLPVLELKFTVHLKLVLQDELSKNLKIEETAYQPRTLVSFRIEKGEYYFSFNKVDTYNYNGKLKRAIYKRKT